jgi:hypothetical protein
MYPVVEVPELVEGQLINYLTQRFLEAAQRAQKGKTHRLLFKLNLQPANIALAVKIGKER